MVFFPLIDLYIYKTLTQLLGNTFISVTHRNIIVICNNMHSLTVSAGTRVYTSP